MSKLDRPRARVRPSSYPALRCTVLRTSTYSASSPLGQAVGSGDDLVLLAADVDHRARVLAVDDRIARLDARRHHVALQQEGGPSWGARGRGAAAVVLVVGLMARLPLV